ncbi:Y-box-binding protein 2-A-like [Portunus trituberculatus]|uniref:Y-box-binding protein 2-A-like n=1 Tax=Portunus trituberculatus TaxID=210409 RepID=UPI001E1CCBED|nr:Y-box-binding protein 2-A-like [Portunus trituberculatus]
MASQQHQGQFKWYNYKRGFGFISDSSTKTDVFVHYSGLKRSLQRRLPREGDNVQFTVCVGDKGPEAREVARTSQTPKASSPSRKPLTRTWDMEAKITACICTAKALAGSNSRRLQVLIPVLLKHNGLPVIRIPQQALGTANPHTPRPRRRHQPLRQDDEQPCHDDPADEALIVEEEEVEGEDEIVDVEGSDTEEPPPVVEDPPKEEEGWTISQNKMRKKKPTAPEAEPTPRPSPRRETVDKDGEEPHTTYYQLRSKNTGTRHEEPGQSLSDLISGFNKFRQDLLREKHNQN